jgi:hypothetical protein
MAVTDEWRASGDVCLGTQIASTPMFRGNTKVMSARSSLPFVLSIGVRKQSCRFFAME